MTLPGSTPFCDVGLMDWPWSRIVAAGQIDEALAAGFSCGDDTMDDWFLSKVLSWCYLGFARCMSLLMIVE